MNFLILVFAVIVGVGCSSRGSEVPARIKEIPAEAVWAGGPDGGAWILCERKPESEDRYRCKIYNDHSGDIWASGEFVLRKYSWDKKEKRPLYSLVDKLPQKLRFSSFDGNDIRLRESLVLLPDGWINYPFHGGGGKRQLFILGKEKGNAIEYK